MKLIYRIQEWLADRIRFIQYPQKQATTRQKWRPFESSPFIQTEEKSGNARLSWTAQLVILLYALILLIVAVLLLVVGGIVLWAIVSSFF